MLSTRSKRTKYADEPLDVELTVVFRLGDEPGDKVTVIENRHVPLVGSVYDSRDVLIKGFVKLLLKAGLTQPKVLSEVLPAVKLLQRRKR